MNPATDPKTLPEWAALEQHRIAMSAATLRGLFDEDPGRSASMTTEAGDLVIDCAKHLVTSETVALLIALAKACGLPGQIEAMFRGEPINTTEDRAALHTALRAPADASVHVDGSDVVPAVHEVLDRAIEFADRVRSGGWTGCTGRSIRTVVNIGIGGSDLGPVMAYEALRSFRHPSITCRFVSNIDGADIAAATDPAGPRDHPVHRLLQELHHPGDADQRTQRS